MKLESTPGGIPIAAASHGKWITLVAAFLGWMFDGFEMGLFPLVGRPALIDLLGEAGQKHVDVWFGLMIAGFLVGAATGGVLFGWLGDRLGRVRAMTLSIFTYAIFMGLCGIANSPQQVFFFRFISSLGMGGEWSLGVALVMEIWPDQSRGLMAGLIGAASNVGFLAIAAIGLVLDQFLGMTGHTLLDIGLAPHWVERLVAHSGWRLMMLIGAVPALLTFFVQLLVPESRRWQHEKSQGSTSHWASRDLLAVVAGTAGPLAMIFLWVPDSSYSLGVKIGGSVVGVGLAVVGFIFPVFRYLSRAGAVPGGQLFGGRSNFAPHAAGCLPQRCRTRGNMGVGATRAELGVEARRGSARTPRFAARLSRRQSRVGKRPDADHFRLRGNSWNDGWGAVVQRNRAPAHLHTLVPWIAGGFAHVLPG